MCYQIVRKFFRLCRTREEDLGGWSAGETTTRNVGAHAGLLRSPPHTAPPEIYTELRPPLTARSNVATLHYIGNQLTNGHRRSRSDGTGARYQRAAPSIQGLKDAFD